MSLPRFAGWGAVGGLFVSLLLLTGLVGVLGMGWLRRKEEETA